ncbi:hypothetical protein OH76DRAFT_1190685 [Lentinus brumalis]|uniref:Uncharacterized protein n=1 Tax=Lentinus brumalis TaxID=2498619 RepID=A0A371CTH5_9APHY|nr:hypothetical protein OH76DRAFT_1190685 [Polyporus brumalis]
MGRVDGRRCRTALRCGRMVRYSGSDLRNEKCVCVTVYVPVPGRPIHRLSLSDMWQIYSIRRRRCAREGRSTCAVIMSRLRGSSHSEDDSGRRPSPCWTFSGLSGKLPSRSTSVSRDHSEPGGGAVDAFDAAAKAVDERERRRVGSKLRQPRTETVSLLSPSLPPSLPLSLRCAPSRTNCRREISDQAGEMGRCARSHLGDQGFGRNQIDLGLRRTALIHASPASVQ